MWLSKEGIIILVLGLLRIARLFADRTAPGGTVPPEGERKSQRSLLSTLRFRSQSYRLFVKLWHITLVLKHYSEGNDAVRINAISNCRGVGLMS